MKIAILVVLSTFFVTGCQINVPEPVVKAPEKPQANTQTVENKSLAKPLTSRLGDNPKRVFQLADLKKATVQIGGKAISTWVMDDDGKREEGMMWLTDQDVKSDEGMLFVFNKPRQMQFWMQNTILPLDIMYFSSAGKLLNIGEGKPFDEEHKIPSNGEAQYVIEMKQGSAKRLGFGTGNTLTLPKDLKDAG